MSAHTPGPWTADRHGAIVAEVGGKPRQVASATGEAPQHGDQSLAPFEIQRANAHLIAAAPDLLAACEASISHCRMECTPESYCGQCEPLFAAIAKARGGR